MARPEGFEPPTLCLEGRRSFQLSYGRLMDPMVVRDHSRGFMTRDTTICYSFTRGNLEFHLLQIYGSVGGDESDRSSGGRRSNLEAGGVAGRIYGIGFNIARK
jgi:hypothetical protein